MDLFEEILVNAKEPTQQITKTQKEYYDSQIALLYTPEHQERIRKIRNNSEIQEHEKC